MFDAIVGDIVRSIYEFVPHKSKAFPLFSEYSVVAVKKRILAASKAAGSKLQG